MRHSRHRDHNRLAIYGLARAGFLQPGHIEEFHFDDGARGAVTIKLLAGVDQMTIEIATGNAPANVSLEIITIDYSRCHLGGRRPWWICPQCSSRRGVLFEERGRWRCRTCLGIPYRSQRCSRIERLAQEIRAMRDELKDSIEPDGHVRPARLRGMRGMRRRRYFALLLRLHAARRTLAKLLRDRFDREIQGWTKTSAPAARPT